MCGRFGQYDLPPPRLEQSFNLTEPPELEVSYNVAPTDSALVVGENPEAGSRSASYLRWGLVPGWADDPDEFGTKLINARLETADQKPAFRDSFRSRRCVVPVNGFYEWRQTGSGKQPEWIHPGDGSDFLCLAGLWASCSGTGSETGLHSFTILTKEAEGPVAELHDRMPVILDTSSYDAWLDAGSRPCRLKQKLLETDPTQLDHHEVTKAVNNPEFNRPECVEAV